MQLATVALVANRFPLWAKYPRTGEQFTLPAVLCAQTITSALLFPILLRDWRAAIGMIATAWPFALIAAAISATPLRSAILAQCYISLWLAALGVWGHLLRSDRARAIASAAAISLTLAVPVSCYLMIDFSTGSAIPSAPIPAALSPLSTSLLLLDPEKGNVTAWGLPALVALAAGVTAVVRRYIRRRSA